jgi:hypothetical protein
LGVGVVKVLRRGDGLLLLSLLFHGFSPSSLDLVVAAPDRVISRGSRVSRLRLGDLYGGARVWVWLWPAD